MLYDIANGSTSNAFRVKLRDSTSSSGAGLTGLTSASSGLVISTVADNEAAATAYTVAGSTIESITTLGTFAAPTATKVRFKEVDATNHPGLYEFQAADARFAVEGAKSLVVSFSGATNLAQTDVVIPLRAVNPYLASFGLVLAKTTNLTGLNDIAATAIVSGGAITTSGGAASSVTTTTNLTNLPAITTDWLTAAGVSAGAVTKVQTGLPTPQAFVDALLADPRLNTGTAQAGTADSITLEAGSPAINYVNRHVEITGGTGKGQSSVVESAVGLVLTVNPPWVITPDATSTYVVGGLAGSSLTAQETANAVWDELRSGHVAAGSTGEAMQTEDGTAQAVGASSITIQAGSPAVTYDGLEVLIVSATLGANQAKRVTATAGLVLTLDSPWSVLPTGVIKYRFVGLAPGGAVASVTAPVSLIDNAITSAKIAADAITATKFATIAVDPNGELLERAMALFVRHFPPAGGSVTIDADGNGNLVVKGTAGATLFTQIVTRDAATLETLGPAS